MSLRDERASLHDSKAAGAKARRRRPAGTETMDALARPARSGQRLPGTTGAGLGTLHEGMDVGQTPSRTGVGLPVAVTADTVKAHALEAFGSAGKVEHWLHRPNWLFQGRTPLQAVQTDPRSVDDELVRIEHGVYI
jgi:hypothetical protein